MLCPVSAPILLQVFPLVNPDESSQALRLEKNPAWLFYPATDITFIALINSATPTMFITRFML